MGDSNLALSIVKIILLLYCYGCVINGSTATLSGDPETNTRGFTKLLDAGSGFINPQSSDHTIKKRSVLKQTTNSNITSKMTSLADSHQQLMVHWAGEGSDVIICLAKDLMTTSKNPQTLKPSAVYISYDYGDSYINKTEFFRFKSDGNVFASIDKFYNHPKFNKHIVFLDKTHKMIFTTNNSGRNFQQYHLSFDPAEITFHPENPFIFLIHDTENSLWVTLDFGVTWSRSQHFVKVFYWMMDDVGEPYLIVLRQEPSTSSVIAVKGFHSEESSNLSLVILNVVDCWVKGDFIFATRTYSKDSNHVDLLISYKRGDFKKAVFQTDLRRQAYHIVDADSGARVMVAVSHSEYEASLYISELITTPGEIKFTLSLDRVFCYMQDKMWTDSWLSDVADSTFADVHKVEGLKGVYIASQLLDNVGINPGVEHLRSVITWDWGGEWQPLTAPHYSADFQPLNCKVENNCSLHLSQRFSQLYPVTRTNPIMTSKSAPGLILATGTLGSSLKGHVGLYMSRDAGLSWHQVLQEYYLFNFGDHGGVLVAAKYFKSHGETDVLKYSTDEGENWQDHKFSDEELRIYGLMTEPGENTTVFTMFGSAHAHHQWLIIKADLRNAFSYNCSKEDYKLWSPSSGSQGSKMSCILGLRETYEHRVPHSNCYNGLDYDRPVKVEVCPCDIQDFECDFGFERAVGMSHCICNKSLRNEPFSPPTWCKPGLFYNRTKGYLKIQGDVCVRGQERNFLPDNLPCPYDERKEFLLMAQKNRIVRWDLATLTLEVLPVRGLQNVVAVEFDIHKNCVYWADIISDTIARQCLGKDSNGTVEVLVKTDLSSVEGLALDWMTNTLYFVDGIKARIQVVRTDVNHAGRMRHTVLGPDVLKKPRGIALHPAVGYMYWTDWVLDDPQICRAYMDGSNVKRLFSKPDVIWPNGITIDFTAERIYFVDARMDFIGSADLDGKHFRKIIHDKEQVSHPFAVAVFKDMMYWDDWKQNCVYFADKDHGIGTQTIGNNLPSLMDLKVYAHSMQEKKNQCSNSETCTHLCFMRGDNTSVCVCPDDMELYNGECYCPGRVKPYSNDTCPQDKNKQCAGDMFKCGNGLCILKLWHCDGDNDCGDYSDELNCGSLTCPPDQFQCHSSGKCISPKWKCDYELDCEDGTDEANCTYSKCSSDQFQCANKMCIPHQWMCDLEEDCRDGSDEVNCTSVTPSSQFPTTCSGNYFMCKSAPHLCIPHNWRCDGERDCADSSDEKNCDTAVCESWQFQCKSKRCIFKAWWCDGEFDCGENDHSDEENCTSIKTTPPPIRPTLVTNSCTEWMFECANRKCIPLWWKCDKVNDCGDNSDEIGCGMPETSPPPPPTMMALPEICHINQFRCINGDCILDSWVCDGNHDCEHGEDEDNCEQAVKCHEFRCRYDGSCIPSRQVCDGIVQCPDRSDEMSCPTSLATVSPGPSCQEGMFPCDNNRCLPLALLCDHHTDCFDESDESNCTNSNMVYQVLRFGVEDSATNATSIKLFWWLPSSPSVQFEFLPTYKVATSAKATWVNTTWTTQTDYLYSNLNPYTTYNLTVYVRGVSNKQTYPPVTFVTATTKEAAPEVPWNVTVTQLSMSQAKVSWLPPHQSYGPLISYSVCMTPPIPPLCKTIHASKTQALIDTTFNTQQEFSFWVKAKNTLYESGSSEVVKLVVDKAADMQAVSLLTVKARTRNTVTLSWESPSKQGNWKVAAHAVGFTVFPQLPITATTTHSCTVARLAPGTQYTFEVVPFHKDYEGLPASIGAQTEGEALPIVKSVASELVKSEGTTVKVSWTRVTDQAPPDGWEYGVYYSVTLKQLLNSDVKHQTKNTSVIVKGLSACESYIFTVGLIGPNVVGPIGTLEELLSTPVWTEFNPMAPPTSLRVLPDTQNDTIMSITWSASCPFLSNNVSYEITVTEINMGLSDTVTVGPSAKQDLQHSMTIEHGGHYKVCVSAAVRGAAPGLCQTYYAPPLPVPSQLQLLEETNGSHVLFWRLPQMPPNKAHTYQYHYIVLMSPGTTVNMSTATQFKIEKAPFIINPRDNNIYSYAVLLESETGYRSTPSEVVSLGSSLGHQAQQRIASYFTFPSLLAVLLVCSALCAALGFMYVKNRRLQNTFSQFTNSHFSTRFGTATFSGSDELDDEDSPVIRGFSDDEPLVIA